MQTKAKPLKTKLSEFAQFITNKDLLLSLVVSIAIVVAGVGLSLQNNKIVRPSAYTPARYIAEPRNRLSFLSNWDGPIYINIAEHGYRTTATTNYFPLYPLAIYSVHLLVNSPLDSALIVSWVCLVGAIYYYIKIIKLYFKSQDNVEALRAALFFILFPTGVFLIASYSESLFAFLALGAIYCALRKRYVAAGLLAMLTTATHVDGVFVLILITLILYETREKIKNIAAAFIIGSLGLLSYMVYLWRRFNNPFQFIATQRNHGWLHHSFFSQLGSFSLLNYIFVIIIVLAVIYWWNRKRSFSIYSGLFLLIPFAGGQFGGFARYCLMVFPVQFMLYDYLKDKRVLYPLVIAGFAVGWTYFLLQYAGGYIGG